MCARMPQAAFGMGEPCDISLSSKKEPWYPLSVGAKALFLIQVYQFFRSSPQKNRARVPGPVWLPMVAPMG